MLKKKSLKEHVFHGHTTNFDTIGRNHQPEVTVLLQYTCLHILDYHTDRHMTTENPHHKHRRRLNARTHKYARTYVCTHVCVNGEEKNIGRMQYIRAFNTVCASGGHDFHIRAAMFFFYFFILILVMQGPQWIEKKNKPHAPIIKQDV